MNPLRLFLVTALAMCSFAANSLLCRQALGSAAIDPDGFTAIRLASGAVMLALLSRSTPRHALRSGKSWASAVALFSYAILFSFAFTRLSAGTGALLLFACVQLTMIGFGLARGERPSAMQWIGLSIAICGLIVLLLPGLSAPPLAAATSMACAGVAWGSYSLIGRGSRNPLRATATNFALTLPMVALLLLLRHASFEATRAGVVYAMLSGALASGVGYAIWYTALRALSATQAAICQLTVPVLASFGGILFLGEALSQRLLIATGAILGGVALTQLRLRR